MFPSRSISLLRSIIDFWLQPGDRIAHIKEPEWTGVVVHIDENLIPIYGVTTAVVHWDDCEYPEWKGLRDDFDIWRDGDVQWTNKLVKL